MGKRRSEMTNTDGRITPDSEADPIINLTPEEIAFIAALMRQ